MKETRVYLADLSSWCNSTLDLENIVECAESQGTVWSLKQFAKQFNNGEEPLCSMLADSEGDVGMAIAVLEDGKILEGWVR